MENSQVHSKSFSRSEALAGISFGVIGAIILLPQLPATEDSMPNFTHQISDRVNSFFIEKVIGLDTQFIDVSDEKN